MAYKPEYWLFPGIQASKHLTERTVQKVFDMAKCSAGIKKSVSVHSLRHSFTMYLPEELLGHHSPNTTEIYTHVTKNSISNIVSPLDYIMNELKQ